MAEKLSFEIIADDRGSADVEAFGRNMRKAAVDVEAAQIKVAKASAKADQATEKYGQGSLQAREAVNRLRAAELQAETATGKHTAVQRKASDAAEEGRKRFSGLGQTMGGLKTHVVEAWASLEVFRTGLEFTARVITEGLQQGLIRANAQVVLGAKTYKEFAAQAKDTAHSLGLTQGEFLNSAGQAALLAKNMGFGQKTAVEFGTQLPDLANKLSVMSSGTRDAAESSDILRSALAGEFDPLQAVGINISANIVQQKALAIQQANNGKLSTQQANALAVMAIVQEQTTSATKTLTTEQGKSAQQVAETTAQWRDYWQVLEMKVAPALVGGADKLIKWNALLMASAVDPKHLDYYRFAIDNTNASIKVGSSAHKAYDAVLDVTKKKTIDATWTTKDYTDALASNGNKLLELRGGETAYYASLQATKDALKENGRTLDVHTAKGRANREALDAQASASRSYLLTMIEQNVPAATFNKRLDQTRTGLIRAAEKFGLSRMQAKNYADAVLHIPHQANTKATFDDGSARAKIAAFRRSLLALNNITVNPGPWKGSYTLPGKASGGPVAAGRGYVVGERGPELFVPNTSGTIIPHGSPGAASTAAQIIVQVNVTQPLASARDIAAAVQSAIADVAASGTLSLQPIRKALR